MLQPAHFIYKTKKLSALLADFKYNKIHLAVVTDDYGGILGIVTMEDLLEQIVGEIWDEDEEVEKMSLKISDNKYEVSGDMPISDMLELFDKPTKYIETESNSVGGWALEQLANIPEPGEQFTYKELEITIREVLDQRILSMIIVYTPSETEEDDDETTEDYSELDEDEEPEIEDNDEENVETLASDEDKKVADVTEEGKEESKEDKIVNQEEVHGTQNETSEVAQPQSTKTESVSQVVEKQPVDQIAQPVQQQSVQQTAQPVAQTPTEPVVEKQATSYTEPQYVAKNQTEPVVENPQQYVPVQQPVESQVQQNYVPQSAPQVVQSQPTDQQNANYTQPQYVAQTQTEPVAEQTQQYVPVQQPVEQAQQPAKQYVQAHQPTVEQPQQYVQVQQPAGQANQSTQQYIPVQPTEPAGQVVQYVQPSTPIDATNYSVEAETNKEVADNQSAQNVQPTEPIRYFASATTEPNNEPNQSQAQRVIIPLGVDAGESSEKPNLKENTEKYISVDESNSENDEQYEEPEYEDIEYTYTNTETSPEGSIKPVTIVSGIGLNDQNEEKSENIDERSPEMKALEDRLYARIMSALTEMNITPTEAREAISNATNTVVLPEEEVTLDLTKFSGKVETFVPLESIPQATWEDVVKRKGHHTYHVTCAKSGGYFIKKAKSTSPYAFVELKDEALEVAIAYAKREKAELKIHDAKGVIEQSMSFGKEKKKSNKK